MYLNCNLVTNKIFLSRDVVFHELIFPFKSDKVSSLSSPISSPSDPTIQDFPTFLDDDNNISSVSFPNTVSPTSLSVAIEPATVSPTSSSASADTIDDNNNSSSSTIPPSISTPSSISPPSPQTTSHFLRRSTRPHKPSSYLQDYHCALISTADQSSSPGYSSKYPLSSVLSYSSLSSAYRNFVLFVTSTPDPKTYSQAVKHSKWRDAMTVEIHALEQKSDLGFNFFTTWQENHWVQMGVQN
ncbi:putative protein TPRXL [Neltuma alba]|uniref:putative protein TPRXL n=1 Tax=Neltuma alba TaxID=207710 RepID=UPI0010A40D15|nr:putative protein TPRXL [Prosopis alba]